MGIKTDNMIFVFGSNLGGIHGAGAAAYARDARGARMGIGVGRTGQSYAIPTKGVRFGDPEKGETWGKAFVGSTLNLNIIKAYVDEFIQYAKDNPHYCFQVTRIGCGLAGLKDSDIAPMFIKCDKFNMPNVYFDNVWMHEFAATGQMSMAGYNIWGTF